MNTGKMIIGISQGDINGISYEIILKALQDTRMLDTAIPVIYGSPKIAAYYRKALNLENFTTNQIQSIDEVNPRRVNIINCIDDNTRVEIGKSTSMAGEASFLALEAATNDLKLGKIQALVTAPINKHNIQSEHFSFPGHTEYLTAQAGKKEALMFMISDVLRVGVVAGHIPIKEVSSFLSIDRIVKKLSLMNDSLFVDFNIRKPRIAVFGLNPHAGDNGLIGSEEQEIIIPAIEKAKELGILAFGPFAADGFFGSSVLNKFDGILAMYHDQGLAPFKALSFDRGVNFTAGLDFVRTSPGHGTAYEIAGKNEASEESFRQAFFLAADIWKNRKMEKELKSNPLKSNKDRSNHQVKDEDIDLNKLSAD